MKINRFIFRGGVKTSRRATSGPKVQDAIVSISEAIQRMFTKTSHKTLCHSELVSELHALETLKQVQGDIKKQNLQPSKPLTIRKALAFTLAETLIVMGIIGVVAALTIPNLNSSTADKEKVAKLQKIYSNLEDAYGRAAAVYGPLDEWFTNDTTTEAKSKRFGERITEFMKVSKNCGTSNSGCIPNVEYKYLNGETEDNYDDSAFYKVVLADGTALALYGGGADVSTINVDIDGLKGQNTFGKDFFYFIVSNENGVEPYGSMKDFSDAKLKSDCFAQGVCTGWVINTGNMDYLKADRTGKCPNGKQLSWTNTSCK